MGIQGRQVELIAYMNLYFVINLEGLKFSATLQDFNSINYLGMNNFERTDKMALDNKIVQIVEYEPKYKAAFKALNEEWISKYFEMEEADYKALDNPEKNILDKGGKIFLALHNNEVLGVCALIKMDDPKYDYEMAKMAVSPKAQGKGIGWLLGQAIINAAKGVGASKIYLEGNTILKASINLYYKLGFQKTTGNPSPYKRVDIRMELDLSKHQ